MNEKTLDTIISIFITELINESKELLSEFYDEGKQFIGVDLKAYLEKQKTKYSHIKTLLRGNTPVYLYEVYFPLHLRDVGIISTESISNLFDQSNYLTIIGDAGSGKSTLTKHLFLNSIKENFGIPILVELRYLNETEGDIEKHILEKIFENKLSASPAILERLLIKGKFVFFLDGFDELNSDVKNKVIENLNAFINKFDKNKFIITSRPYSHIENLPLFRNVRIKQLEGSKNEIDGFIDHQLRKEPELAAKIKKSLKENESEYIQSFLTNPLLLTLYILTFQTNADIPNKKYIFYRRVINALFSEHDSKTKLGYVREKRSKLSQEQFEDILKAFCFISYFEQRFDFDFDYINLTLKKVKSKIPNLQFDNNNFIYDLTSAVSLWTEDNGNYGFAHRSLQEYFAALFIKNLNPVANEQAYFKLIDKFGGPSNSREVENLISLCLEMDHINFSKFYYLPLLKEVLGILDNKNDRTLTKSYILFFTDGLICGKETNPNFIDVNIKDNVYRTIYVHLRHTQRLFDTLRGVAEFIKSNNPTTNLIINEKKIQFIKIEPEIDGYFEGLLINEATIDLSRRFYDFLITEIENTNKLIKQSFKTDKDILDLI